MTRHYPTTLLQIVVVNGLALGGCGPPDASRADVQRAMTPLIDGVTRYRDANQKLPDSLNDLVPAILSHLPDVPTGGKVWEYEVFGQHREKFALTLRLDREIIIYRPDIRGSWAFCDPSF